MRRMWSVLLLALFSFSLITPVLFASDPESNLPACCRRNGKHQCALDTDGGSSVPVLKSSRCPDFGAIRGVSANPPAGLAPHTEAISRFIFASGSTGIQPDSLFRSTLTRVEPERGPPPSLLS